MSRTTQKKWPIKHSKEGIDHWLCHKHDHAYILAKLKGIPYTYWPHVESHYRNTYKDKGRQAANFYLLTLSNIISHPSFKPETNDDAIKAQANNQAKECKRIASSHTKPIDKHLHLLKYLQQIGITTPSAITSQGVIERTSSSKWWRRKLRDFYNRHLEEIALHLNVVNKKQCIYSSDIALNRRRQQKQRNSALMDEMIAVNELGYEVTMAELVEH